MVSIIYDFFGTYLILMLFQYVVPVIIKLA